MTSSSQILVVCPNPELQAPFAAALGALGAPFATFATVTEGLQWCRSVEFACRLVVVDLESPDAWSLIGAVRAARGDDALIVALVRSTTAMEMKTLFSDARLTNFLAVTGDDVADANDLRTTVAKILSGDIFGWARYLATRQRAEQFVIRSSRHRKSVVDTIETFALRAGCHRRVAEAFAVAGDELITNAVYNAPVDSQGVPRFAHFSRDRQVELAEGEEARIQLGFDGRRLALAATDCFGTLQKTRVVDYLSKCFTKGADQVDSKEGGAGLGLYYVFNSMHHLVINISPGKCTEIIGIVDVTRSYKEHSSRPKSFNIFVGEGT